MWKEAWRRGGGCRSATARGDFEAVIAEYRKARGLMASLAKSSSVWQNLFAEVDKVRLTCATAARHQLCQDRQQHCA